MSIVLYENVKKKKKKKDDECLSLSNIYIKHISKYILILAKTVYIPPSKK